LAVSTAAGCAAFEEGPDPQHNGKTREERLAALEKSSGESQKQLQELAEQQKQMLAELERIADATDRLTAQSDAAAKLRADQSKALDAALNQARFGRTASPRSESSPECRWLGRRTVLMLLRDDLIAADGFTRMYTTLGCPLDQIGPVFACVAPQAQVPQGQSLETQIDYCWTETSKLRRTPQ
jgi:hypothetical protein